ncbi:MAG: transcriptional regulator, ArsR family [Thermoplasmatales archaeon A-plasma]|nr:MAG: transcriptional regulator, ArsR family [Thermoplasmatales archaeon A-plasma]
MTGDPPLREAILQIIRTNPGIHFREIQRKSGAAIGQVEYHLYQLERSERVHYRIDGKVKRYFTSEGTGLKQRKIIYYLRNPVSRDLIYVALQKGGVDSNYVSRGRKSLQEKKKALILEMLEEGILRENEGEHFLYLLNDPGMVTDTLRKFRESFLDTLTENIISMLDRS